MRKIIIICLVISVSLFAQRFYKSGTNYVIDKKEHMMWQDTKDNINIKKSQVDAKEYCQKLRLGGYSDWFLPSRDDYKNIIDMSRKNEEMTIVREFGNTLQGHYWTADRTWRNFGLWGYYVYFKSGTFYYDNKTYLKHIRCVRELNKK